MRRLTVLLAALLLLACGPLSDRDAGWRGTVDTVANRAVVRNPPEPLLDDGAVSVRELWARPLGWSSERRNLWEPGPEVRVGGGRVYVLDPVHERVQVRRATDGRRLRGLDPDSAWDVQPFVGSHALAVTGGSVVVADTGTVVVLDGEDGALRDHLSMESADVIDVYGAGGGAFLLFAYGGSGVAWRYYEGPGAEGQPYRPPVTRSETHPEAAQSECWKLDGLTDGLLLLSCAHPVWLRFDRASEIRREVSFDRPPVEPTREQLEAVRQAARQRARDRRPDVGEELLRRMVEREERRHPLVKKHRAPRLDPTTGRIAVLEQTPAYMGGGSASLLLFTEDGRHLATLPFGRHWLDFDFRDGIVYAVTRREGSPRPVLVAYELDLTGKVSGTDS